MYRLIVVDDEQKIRDGIADCYPWAELGFEMAGTFPDGKAAFDYVERYCVDVVLSDIRMPKMDGLELARQLQESYPKVKVILLSGFAEFQYAQEAIRFGVREYILKPIQYDNLIQVFTRFYEELNLENNLERDVLPAGYYDQIVEQTIHYIEENYCSANLDQAAVLVSLSPNYLSRIFKRKRGVNFSDYLLDVKMKTASRLLCDISLKTYEVAAMVGYDNPKNFSRAFKQYSGKTPKEYREQGGSL